MACRLIDAKPLSEPMMLYCQLNPKQHISAKFYKKTLQFSLKKLHLRISSAKLWHFCLGLNVLDKTSKASVPGQACDTKTPSSLPNVNNETMPWSFTEIFQFHSRDLQT